MVVGVDFSGTSTCHYKYHGKRTFLFNQLSLNRKLLLKKRQFFRNSVVP